MSILEQGFDQIKREYIFPIIEKKLIESQKQDLLNLGIGDVALPLIEPAATAFIQAIHAMQERPIGYPPAHGDQALKEAIFNLYYKGYNLDVSDIFISDGINSDLGNLQELVSADATFGLHEPSYPVPFDVCLMAGRKEHLTILSTDGSTCFLPHPPKQKIDVMYLCSPNNPSGTAMDYQLCQAWVHWANQHHSILIIDQAYADFIQDSNIPKSIYEIEGAKTCAIELRSFSKSAGFTGLRCSYSVVPSTLKHPLKPLWAKRMATKSNGVSFPVQKAALAALTPQGLEASWLQVKHYLTMAEKLSTALQKAGLTTWGAHNAPYVFVKCPEGLSSWDFFDFLLNELSIISVPGCGFGPSGEGYLRLSGFITEKTCNEAIERLNSPTFLKLQNTSCV